MNAQDDPDTNNQTEQRDSHADRKTVRRKTNQPTDLSGVADCGNMRIDLVAQDLRRKDARNEILVKIEPVKLVGEETKDFGGADAHEGVLQVVTNPD